MRTFIRILSSSAVGLGLLAGLAQAEEISIATVNNGDMIIMQKLSAAWEKETGNTINWVVLEENVLRERLTTDIATKGVRRHDHRRLRNADLGQAGLAGTGRRSRRRL
jgi:ABC-type glycerol-3-phosphate transport system substrate-binding protein